jgi:DNA primase
MTEQQVAIWKRHLALRGAERVRVVANFDPDAAGKNAAAKTIDLLIAENFEIKIVTLEGGLDPDRFVRERGVDAYVQAIRGAQRLEEFLIERARQLFPGSSTDQKVKQLDYLLPFMHRMPEMLARTQFAQDAAQQLKIDSAVLQRDLHLAALKRRTNVSAAATKPADRPSFAQNFLSNFALGRDVGRAGRGDPSGLGRSQQHNLKQVVLC